MELLRTNFENGRPVDFGDDLAAFEVSVPTVHSVAKLLPG